MLLAGSFKMTLEQHVASMKPLSDTKVLPGLRRRRQNRAEIASSRRTTTQVIKN
jgi:hypothetical protein